MKNPATTLTLMLICSTFTMIACQSRPGGEQTSQPQTVERSSTPEEFYEQLVRSRKQRALQDMKRYERVVQDQVHNDSPRGIDLNWEGTPTYSTSYGSESAYSPDNGYMNLKSSFKTGDGRSCRISITAYFRLGIDGDVERPSQIVFAVESCEKEGKQVSVDDQKDLFPSVCVLPKLWGSLDHSICQK